MNQLKKMVANAARNVMLSMQKKNNTMSEQFPLSTIFLKRKEKFFASLSQADKTVKENKPQFAFRQIYASNFLMGKERTVWFDTLSEALKEVTSNDPSVKISSLDEFRKTSKSPNNDAIYIKYGNVSFVSTKTLEGYIFQDMNNPTWGHSGYHPSLSVALCHALTIPDTTVVPYHETIN